MSNSVRTVVLLGVFLLAPLVLHGDDWPEWRGAGHAGVWNDTGILESLAPCCTFMRIPSAGGTRTTRSALVADDRAVVGHDQRRLLMWRPSHERS